MERVEVLEGPQGTLFGGGAQAGAIRYITNKPKLGVTGGDVNAAYGVTAGGDPNTTVNATLNLPFGDSFALRGVIFSERRGGYIDNVPATIAYDPNTVPTASLPGGDARSNNAFLVETNTNPVDYQGVRLSALWKMNDNWDALLQQNYQNMLWKILSIARLRQGKDALEALRRAAELLPEDAEAHANLGSELHSRGEWAAARSSLGRSLDLEPRNADALIEAADAERALRRPRDAIPLYERALVLDPHRREARNNLANAFLELNQPEPAARHYRQALALKPEDAQVLCNLANALRQLGHLDEALECSRRAIALSPGLAMPAYNTYDASVGFAKDQWEVTVFGQNLSDSNASTFTTSGQDIKAIVPLRPRVIGLKAGLRF